MFLNRFTSLPFLLDLLFEKEITLLSPETWADRNDAHYIRNYRQRKKLNTVVAACFSVREETFHHWQVFSPGVSGACIEFDRDMLLDSIPESDELGIFRYNNVRYCDSSELKSEVPAIDDWPFLKCRPFEDEGEFRIIYQSKQDGGMTKRIPITLKAIRKIILSPWLTEAVSLSLCRVIRRIPDCKKLQVLPSDLLRKKDWMEVVSSPR